MAEWINSDLYHWSKKTIDCFRHLEENLNSLRDKMKDLKDLSEDVKRRVEVIEEEGRVRRTNQVNSWLQKVEGMETQVNEILERGPQEIQNKSLRNFPSTYRFGSLVIEKLDAVNQLMDRGRFDVVADRLPRALVEEKPMEKTVGLDSTFEKVWSFLRDDDVGIIGVFGTGGVGKTTLLKKINNEFLKTSLDFDVVIWVEVSKDSNAERVQDQILERLGKSTTASRDAKAREITRALSRKKFVLLLDDLWKRFDLLQVGVPLPDNQNKSKVVFTTRSEDVCGYMEANKKIRVEYLPRKEAWELFQRKVGEDTLNLHPEIPELAMIAAEECGGLPVALITIGRAMASRKTPREWKQAIEVLKNNPSKFAGMGDEVFPLLKFSYDSLLNDTVRSCFIYCSLFSGLIWDVHVVELWIGEGFLDEFDDRKEARNKGHEIIESLKLACLLETVDWVIPYVRMHDVIRDMAVWIACECGRKTGKFLTGDRLIEESATSIWKEAERTSLWSDSIEKLSEILICPNLLTLLARGNKNLKVFPCGFFRFMHALRVLDLSNSNLTELPVEISGLVSLQFLDLSFTEIRELPIWFKNLVNLKILRLVGTFGLEIIPEQVISSLSMLQSLDMAWSGYKYQTLDGNVLSSGNEALLAEIESLEHLQDMRITIKSAPAFRMLLSSQKLRSRTNGLFLMFCEGLTSLPLSCLKDMKHLEVLLIDGCVDLKEMAADLVEKRRKGLAHDDIQRPKIMRDGYFNNLKEVILTDCDNILHLTWLIFTPNLQRLLIRKCKSLKEVISDHDNDGRVAAFGGNSSIFPSLEFLALYELTELKSIYGHALPFPSLRWIYIKSCPMLRKLPLDSNSAKNCLEVIAMEKQEYDALEWDDEATRLHFLPFIGQPWRREESDVVIAIIGMPSSAPTSIFTSRKGWMGLRLITWGLQGTSLFLLTRNIAGAQSTDVEVAILNYGTTNIAGAQSTDVEVAILDYGTTNIAGAQYTHCAYAQYTRYTIILLERGSWLVGSGFEFELL